MLARRSIALLSAQIALGLLAPLAIAQVDPSTQELQTVEVVSIRDPDAFSVTRAMANIELFESIPADQRNKIRLSFHVLAKDKSPMPKGARMSLATKDGDKPMELLPYGELVVPKLSTEEAEGAEFVSNMKKGSLRVTYFIQPKITHPMTMGQLRESLVQAKAAYKKLYGGMLGWSVPTFTCAHAMFMGPNSISVHAAAGDAAPVWSADPSTRVVIPVNDPKMRDDFVIDWGSNAPFRMGGCVEDAKKEST